VGQSKVHCYWGCHFIIIIYVLNCNFVYVSLVVCFVYLFLFVYLFVVCVYIVYLSNWINLYCKL